MIVNEVAAAVFATAAESPLAVLAAAMLLEGPVATVVAGSDIGPFVGMTVQLAGVIVAVLAGVIAVLHAVRTPQKAAAQP